MYIPLLVGSRRRTERWNTQVWDVPNTQHPPDQPRNAARREREPKKTKQKIPWYPQRMHLGPKGREPNMKFCGRAEVGCIVGRAQFRPF